MRSEDIMMGDWVRLRYKHWGTNEEVVKDFKVSQIRKAWDGNELDAWCSESGNMGKVSRLEPIPITSEILEKNGFSTTKKFRTYYYHQSGVYISVGMWGRITVSSEGNRFGNRMNIDCQYVHELQHALRLCGITKEIIV